MDADKALGLHFDGGKNRKKTHIKYLLTSSSRSISANTAVY